MVELDCISMKFVSQDCRSKFKVTVGKRSLYGWLRDVTRWRMHSELPYGSIKRTQHCNLVGCFCWVCCNWCDLQWGLSSI